MTILEEQNGRVTVASIVGKVDSVQAAELESRVMAILERGVRLLLFDCERLDYINSAGLRVFLLAAKHLTPDGALAFCSLTPNVKLVFKTIGFDRILTLFDTREAALLHLSSGPAES